MPPQRKSPVNTLGAFPEAIPSLVVAAGHLQSEIAKQLGALSAHWDLTYAKLRVLHCIALSEGQLTCAEIGRLIGASRQSALKQANLLYEQGFLSRSDNPADARAPLFELSPTGRTVFNELAAIWTEHNKTVSTELARMHVNLNDIQQAIAAIKSVTQALRKRKIPEPT